MRMVKALKAMWEPPPLPPVAQPHTRTQTQTHTHVKSALASAPFHSTSFFFLHLSLHVLELIKPPRPPILLLPPILIFLQQNQLSNIAHILLFLILCHMCVHTQAQVAKHAYTLGNLYKTA